MSNIDDFKSSTSPEAFKQFLQRTKGIGINDTDDEMEESLLVPKDTRHIAAEELDKDLVNYNATGEKARFIGDKVCVELETSGRFDTPELVYFSDYSVEDINNVALSRQEDILENIVAILNKANSDKKWNVENMLLEEFYESLVAIKYRFNNPIHVHKWLCNYCQKDVPDSQRKLSEFEIDLTTIKYVPIEDVEEQIREHFKNVFNNVTDEQFEQYLINRYGDVINTTRDDEANNMGIKEPVIVQDGNKKYEYNFPRVKDLLRGMRLGQKKFDWKIKQIRNRPIDYTAENVDEVKSDRQDELDRIENDKAKYVILATKAMSLVAFNSNSITSDEEKIKLVANMSKTALKKMGSLNDRIRFGIQDEREIKCNICHQTEKRLLQRTISPIELLPLDDDNQLSSGRKSQIDTGLDIYFTA